MRVFHKLLYAKRCFSFFLLVLCASSLCRWPFASALRNLICASLHRDLYESSASCPAQILRVKGSLQVTRKCSAPVALRKLLFACLQISLCNSALCKLLCATVSSQLVRVKVVHEAFPRKIATGSLSATCRLAQSNLHRALVLLHPPLRSALERFDITGLTSCAFA